MATLHETKTLAFVWNKSLQSNQIIKKQIHGGKINRCLGFISPVYYREVIRKLSMSTENQDKASEWGGQGNRSDVKVMIRPAEQIWFRSRIEKVALRQKIWEVFFIQFLIFKANRNVHLPKVGS